MLFHCRSVMPASFSTLATVSLQLILQHLDARSIVATALCSRHTLAAASAPFAMRFLSPLALLMSEGCRCGPRSLLRFVDVELRFPCCIFDSVDRQIVLSNVDSIPRLRSLDLSAERTERGMS